MIAVLLAILMLTVAGLPLAMLFNRAARASALVGLAVLYGTGAGYLVMLAMAIVGVPWTLPVIALIVLLGSAAATAIVLHRSAAPDAIVSRGNGFVGVHLLVDLLTLLTLAGYGFFATLAPLWEWDFWAIWGLKARVFFEHQGIDWRFLESPFNAFCHPDYPLLVPLNFDLLALAQGAWSDRWLGLLYVAWAGAVALVVRDLLRDELPPIFASVGCLVGTSIATTRFVGLADGPLIAFGGLALLMIRRGMADPSTERFRNGAILLGFAASTKNEGMALIVAVAIGLALADPRRARQAFRLWPAPLIAVAWLLPRAVHRLPSYLATSSALDHVRVHLTMFPHILIWLAAYLPSAWYWIAVAVSWILLAAARRDQRLDSSAIGNADRFVIYATIVQLLFYLASYLATPYDVQWHISTSWPRLVAQIALPISVVTVIQLSKLALAGSAENLSREKP